LRIPQKSREGILIPRAGQPDPAWLLTNQIACFTVVIIIIGFEELCLSREGFFAFQGTFGFHVRDFAFQVHLPSKGLAFVFEELLSFTFLLEGLYSATSSDIDNLLMPLPPTQTHQHSSGRQ
jgi:hypothetical protein